MFADIVAVQGISEKCSSRCGQCVPFIAASNSGWRRQSEKYLVNRKHARYIYGTQVCRVSTIILLLENYGQRIQLIIKVWFLASACDLSG